MTVEAYAKVNLTLEVYRKRPDGYHALRSVVQPITLADTLEIEPTEDGSISSDTGYGEKDLIVKAARTLASTEESVHRFSLGCRIRVTKRIPAGGGLGGGSADAAATLLALNDLWQLCLAPEQLAALGADVGSDIPALVLAQHYRAPVLMEGRGEKVSLLPSTMNLPLPTSNLVLANPGVHSSTPEVFARCTPRNAEASPSGDATLGGDATLLSRENDFAHLFFNDLQPAAIALHPEIGVTLAALRSLGATDVLMSGSGATVFGFAKDAAEAERFAREMRKRGYSAWSCQTL